MLEKDTGAFLTIGEVSARFGIAAHILRYWETKFSRLRPLQRAGNRRYYRPEDVAMVDQINRLLNEQGYTVSGAAKLLSSRGKVAAPDALPIARDNFVENVDGPAFSNADITALRAVRDRLATALETA